MKKELIFFILVFHLLLTGCSPVRSPPTVSHLERYGSGNFTGSLFTYGYDSQLSDSNALLIVPSDTRNGTPQFLIQNGGAYQASFITRSFMVVNQNNSLLNSAQNNDCRDWGFIHADCNTASTGADFGVTDDIESQGIIYADSGLRAHSNIHGAYLGLADKSIYTNGFNGSYITNDYLFCDYVANNFTETGWIIIQDESSEYNQAFAEAITVYNTSCVELINNPNWDTNFTNVKWTLKEINMISQAGGLFGYEIGDNEQSGFNIHSHNLKSDYAVTIHTKNGKNNTNSLFINNDMNGNINSKGLVINMHSSKNVTDSNPTAINIIGDGSNVKNSHSSAISIDLVGKASNSDFDAIKISKQLSHIIHSGETETLSRVYSESNDITSDVTDTSIDTKIFKNDNDFVYVGGLTEFKKISFALSSTASRNLRLKFYYCDTSGNWISFTPSDGTNGMRQSGIISYNDLSNRGTCNYEHDGTPFADTTNYYYIAIKRTRNRVTPPKVNYMSVSGDNNEFLLREDYVKYIPISSAPEVCSAATESMKYYDSDIHKYCYCDGTSWVRVDDPSTGC